MITIRQRRLPGMDEPLAELAAYFRIGTKLADEELARLALAARAAGSRWEAIAAACGITTHHDLGGVTYRITGETGRGAAVLRHQVRARAAHRQRAPRPAADLGLLWMRAAGHRPRSGRSARPRRARPRRAAPGWPATRPPRTNGAASRSPA